MTKTQLGKLYLSISLIFILLLTLSTGLAAQAPTTVAQAPTRVRPTVDPSGDSVTASTDKTQDSSEPCAAVHGTAIHWGVGELGNVNVDLAGGGWQTYQVTSDDGRYNFSGLGVGIGILHITPPIADLKPMIDNAVVRLTCDYATQAVIGIYGGDERPTPPGHIAMQASSRTVLPGNLIEFHLTVSNSLPNPISQVIVTDLFPDGLVIEDVSTSKGMIEILNDQLLTAMIGDVPENGQVNISVTVRVADGLTVGSQRSNTATLFYAESVADQASQTINIGSPVEDTIADASTNAGDPNQIAAVSGQAIGSTSIDSAGDAPAPLILPITGITTKKGAALASSLFILTFITGLLFQGIYWTRNRPDGGGTTNRVA